MVRTTVRRRCFGLDVHREFAQVAVWDAGVVVQVGRVATTPEELRMFADSLGPGDGVGVGGDRQHVGDRHTADLPGRAGGGVQPGQDPGDRRGEGEDRHGRRGDPGPVAGCGLSAGGVAAGRSGDWSEAGQGDALYDLASLTLGQEEHLGDVVAG